MRGLACFVILVISSSCFANGELETAGRDLCSNPLATVCAGGLDEKYDELVKSLRDQVSQVSQADRFDLQAARTLAAQKRFDDLVQTADPAATAAQIKQLQDQEISAAKLLLSEQQKQLVLEAKLEKIIFANFHLKPADLNPFIDSVKQALLNAVKGNAQFDLASDEQVLRLSEADIVHKIKAIKFNTLSELAKDLTVPGGDEIFQKVSANSAILEGCQADGLAENAAYAHPYQRFYVCPGLTLKFLSYSKGDLRALSFVAGHELSHSFDSHQYDVMTFQKQKELNHKFPRAKADQITSDESFKKINQCVDKNYIQDPAQKFSTIESFLAQLKERGVPNLKAAFDQASSAGSAQTERALFLKRKILVQQNNFKQWDSVKKDLISRHRYPARIIDLEKGELEADWGGTEVVISDLMKTPLPRRLSQVKAALQLFCSPPKTQEILDLAFEGMSDPAHPPSRFRVENFFRNKKIRELIGCSPLSEVDRPACGL